MAAWRGLGLAALLIVASPAGPSPDPGTRAVHSRSGAVEANVKFSGARGDGVSDDTGAIQASIDRVPDGGTVYFPPGTYLVNNVRVANRVGLRFVGEGASSIIKRMPLPGNVRIATFEHSTDVVITNLAFDANGIEAFGGVNFYDVKRVRIEGTRFIDSRPQGPATNADHYAYVFGHGQAPSEDIQILNNRIEDLQLEVDHSRRVRIEGNVSVRGAFTAGIGIWAVGHRAVAEGYVITRNTVVDPFGAGIAVLIDQPTYANNTFRRIGIMHNRIIRKKTAGSGLPIGAGDASVRQHGNVFEDIAIEGNVIEHAPGAPPSIDPIVGLQSSELAGFRFLRVTIKDNHILGTGDGRVGWAMDLRRIHSGVVERNVVRGVANGIAIIDDQRNSGVWDNLVGATHVAYHFSSSGGGNRFERNRYFGRPITALEVAGVASSDIIRQPRLVSPPPAPQSRPDRPQPTVPWRSRP